MPKAPLLVQSIFLCACALAAGCGPGQGDLSGKVSLESKLLATGSVHVRGSDGIVKAGPIQEDGTYEVKDIAAGDIKITVTSRDPANIEFHPRKRDAEPPPPKDNSKWFPIPDEYGDFYQSDLTFRLNPGKNMLNIDLKEKNP